MSYMNVIHFLLNITSLKQPDDSSIIRAFKAIFRQHQQHWIIEQLDTGKVETADKAKPNVCHAIKWSKEALASLARLSENTIRNCWSSAKVLSSPVAVQLILHMGITWVHPCDSGSGLASMTFRPAWLYVGSEGH